MNQLHARRAELCLLVCVFSAVFIALDPFHLSILSADPTFQAKRVPQPPLSVLHSFPRDLESRLSRSRRWSVGGFMGPESIALDPTGGGPYTGVADGRIMKWHGPEVGWREFAYSSKNRLLRHWLKGPRAGETEVLVVLPGYPDNIRLNSDGDLWVAMHCRRNWISRFSGSHPWLRRAFLQLPLPFTYIYKLFHGISPHGILAKYTTDGDLEVFEDVSGSVVKYASEVDEHEGQLWIGSVLLPYISVHDLHKNSSLPDNV
ncbi:hypothetical protein KP509_36G025300 [Ceratopteris richardii]|uniref:Strictosidine synthase n=1 Tax=Ceratopteris richardii TaxID=49495 RepID=A0A8T2QCU0_CERRI|nr:hypothetical protein KP509_36G025300 [Ceratopteris richardii]